MRKNRLKKVIASITVVSIVFSCLFLNWEYGGLTAKASGWFLYVGGIDNTKSVAIEDTCSDYPGWSYNAANNTLTLNGYSGIANNSVNAGASGKSANIVYIGTSPLTIELVGSNRISDSTNMNNYYGIYSEQPVTITGSGSLDVNVGNAVDDAGIFVPGSKLTIESGNVTVKSNGYAIGAHGLHVKGGTVDLTGGTCGFSDWNGGGLTVSGGSLKATGNGTTLANYAGICSYEGIKIEGGSLNAYGKQYGIFCDNANTDIKSGIVEITGDKQAYTGFPITTSLAGMGWTNAQGTGAGTAIAAGTTLTSFPYLKMKFPVTAAADGSSEGTPASEGTELQDASGNDSGYRVTSSDSANATVAYEGTTADSSKTSITIPDTVTDASGNVYKVTEIKEGALKNNEKLKIVTIGSNVETIGNSAFEGCKNLKTVKMGSSVEKIGSKAFKNCKKLTKVTLPSTVTEIGSNAFSGDSKLSSITISTKSLKKVGKNALKGIKSTATIKLKGTKKQKAAAKKKITKSKTGYKSSMKIK